MVILHQGDVNGASNSVLRALPGLERRGWNFVFWTPPGALADRLRADGRVVDGAARPITGYSIAALRLAPGARRRLAELPGYVSHLRQFIVMHSPIVAHANTLHTLLEARVARHSGVATVLHIHEMAPAGRKAQIATAIAGRAAIEVVAVSKACAQHYRRRGTLPRIVQESAPLGPRVSRSEDLTRPVVVGTVAVIARRKGVDLFVEAATIARRQLPALEFHLVGSASEPLDAAWGQAVLERARAVGIHCQASADVARVLAGWDLFVLASRRDPFPLSVLEAMASGLPVIATAVDGLREQVTPDTGMLTAPEDPEALAAAIIELARSPRRRASMGAAGRERLEREFNPDVQAQGLHAAYLAALQRARHQDGRG